MNQEPHKGRSKGGQEAKVAYQHVAEEQRPLSPIDIGHEAPDVIADQQSHEEDGWQHGIHFWRQFPFTGHKVHDERDHEEFDGLSNQHQGGHQAQAKVEGAEPDGLHRSIQSGRCHRESRTWQRCTSSAELHMFRRTAFSALKGRARCGWKGEGIDGELYDSFSCKLATSISAQLYLL